MGQPAANKVEESHELDRVHELSWGLLDNTLNGQEMAELEDLLLCDPHARESYVRCVQLHADLASYFAPASNSATPLVLGLLNDTVPNVNMPATEKLS